MEYTEENPFAGRFAVVTGGSRGIGASVTSALREQGCKVAVLSRSQTSIGDLNILCDVADEAAQLSAFEEISRNFPRLDFAFINAGITHFSGLMDLNMNDWDNVMNTNLRGALITLRESAKFMQSGNTGGCIITCCSLSSFNPEKYIAPYNASKAALASLTKTAARELGKFHIRVNGIAPGLTLTDVIAGTESIPGYHETISKRTTYLNRLGTTEDIAGTVLLLMQMQWVTGQILIADGGLSLHTPSDPEEFFGG